MKKILLCLMAISTIAFGQIKNPSTGVDRFITRGDHSILTWRIKDNLENHEFLFVVKSSKEPSANRLIQKGNYSTYSGLVSSYSGNVTTIIDTIYTVETNNWQSGNYFYDIWDNTDSVTIVSGLFTVNPDVGTPFDGLNPSSLNIYTVALDTPSANNNFIIGMDSTNKWYQKTLAQTKTILGIDTITNAGSLPDSIIYTSEVSDFVTKSTSQTITGQKNFSDSLVINPNAELVIKDTLSQSILFYNPFTAAYGYYGLSSWNAWVNTDGRPDVGFAIGYNLGVGGGVINSNDVGMGIMMESHYDGNGYDATEFHLMHVSPSGNQIRFLTSDYHKDTRYTSLVLQATAFGLRSQNNVLYSEWDSTGQTYHYPYSLKFEQNNTPIIYQNNGAELGYLGFPYFDQYDRWYLNNAYIMRAGGQYLILDSTYLRMRNKYGIQSFDADSNSFNILRYDDSLLVLSSYNYEPANIESDNLYLKKSNGSKVLLENPTLPYDTLGVETGWKYVNPNNGDVKQVIPLPKNANSTFDSWTWDGTYGYRPTGWRLTYISGDSASGGYVTNSNNRLRLVDNGSSFFGANYYDSSTTAGEIYNYSFNVTQWNADAVYITVAGVTINIGYAPFSVGFHTGEVTATGSSLFELVSVNDVSDVIIDNVRVWEKTGAYIQPTYEVKNSALNILNPTTDDTLFLGRKEAGAIYDSIAVFDIQDSIAIQVYYNDGSVTNLITTPDTLITDTTIAFDTTTIPDGSKIYLCFIYIGDSEAYLRSQIYWRE